MARHTGNLASLLLVSTLALTVDSIFARRKLRYSNDFIQTGSAWIDQFSLLKKCARACAYTLMWVCTRVQFGVCPRLCVCVLARAACAQYKAGQLHESCVPRQWDGILQCPNFQNLLTRVTVFSSSDGANVASS